MSSALGGVVLLVLLGFVLGMLYGTATSGHAELRPVTVVPAATAASLLAQGMPTTLGQHEPSATGLHAHMLAPHDDVSPPGSLEQPYLLIGVISSPTSFGRREMLRSFASASSRSTPSARRVATEFVFGTSLYEGEVAVDTQRRLAAEARAHGDVVFVDARERLPHVGKATEKSAAWWLTAPKRSGASWFCKTDDDSLLHHQHLASALAAAERQARSPNILFSYVRWRGWLPDNRFQACGGGWGGPVDAIRHIEDPETHCGLAEGPFPQGTGQLTCLSRPLALALAHSVEFDAFQRIAMVRNDFGVPCKTADECALHPFGQHMWHHEDAGISYNVWRASSALNLSVSLVHMPERGWIWPWFSPKIAEARQSARAILMHKVTPQLLPEVLASWKVELPAPDDLMVDCSQSCATWGWKYMRRQCAPPPPLSVSESDGHGWRGFNARWNGTLCKHDPVEAGWRCCFLRTADGKE